MFERSAIDRALAARSALIERLVAEDTDAYRLFNGAGDGIEGLTIDRYGGLVLAQTFREPLGAADRDALEGALRARLSFDFAFACNHRGRLAPGDRRDEHAPQPRALEEFVCREFGVRFFLRARHRGQDPWLFLDLRAGRRRLRELAPGRSLLNLFAYTASAGITAAAAGASEVWNVDFASSNLSVGRRNAELNALPSERVRFIEEDCLPVLRQLAGLPIKGRARARSVLELAPRRFELVLLDPPAWSKGPFGAVDVAGDYPSLFKPALLATAAGGTIIATNHVASVALEAWIDTLQRAARKAGRPLHALEIVAPEEDFPSFDAQPPLKIAVCRV